MPDDLQHLLKETSFRIKHGRPLETRAANIWSHLWRGLDEQLQSLIGQADSILRGKLDPHLRCCVNVAAGVLRTSVADMRKVCVAAASETQRREVYLNKLRIGFGVPGVQGCASAAGDKIVWAHYCTGNLV